MLMLDNKMSEMLDTISPHRTLLDINTPRYISNNIAMPATVISNANNWLHHQEDEPPSEKMKEFAIS